MLKLKKQGLLKKADGLQVAIIKTLAYADVFGYPLREEEIGRWLVSSKRLVVSSRQIRKTIKDLVKGELIGIKGGYHFLRRRGEIVEERKEREVFSKEKWGIAKQVGRWLGWLPTVKMVAVTGALAMNNCDEDDDIDLMIVTADGWLWTTRLAVTVLLGAAGLRRKPGDKRVKDKVCVNVWLSEGDLVIEPGEHGLYLAHEVLQAEPVVVKGDVYARFLKENGWVREWLGKAWRTRLRQGFGEAKEVSGVSRRRGVDSGSRLRSNSNLVEKLVYRFQRWYMKGKMTREEVSMTRAMFHPRNTGKWVKEEVKVKAKKIGHIALNNRVVDL